MRYLLAAAVSVSFLQAAGDAQSVRPATVTPTPSASLAGAVRDEANNPVQATVTIATQGLRQSALTAADGSFTFSNLKTGVYAICAVPTAKSGAPFVDSCLWQDRNSLQVPLTPGQNQQGVVVPVRHGHPLKVRVNDPSALLPAPIGTTAANHLAIHVIGPSGLAQPVLIATCWSSPTTPRSNCWSIALPSS